MSNLMTALGEELRRRTTAEDDRRRGELEDYRAILARADAPQAGDAARMADLLAALRITPADVEADLAAIREASELGPKVLGPDEASERQRRADAIAAQFNTQFPQVQQRDLWQERQRLTAPLDASAAASRRIAELRSARPRAFGIR